ncbi:lytic transglycosylase [Kangiella sediminilitoris]|uniref:Lytic transglycosylase catalytic n=1 Tax=Kangiella sediminilitoris TaxID=1144748 RepID=A0A1B3B9A9_9GAMM|nr:LysM peptidoglycan-binding domain-containing protein [Kangiella sediminilitoris]AOE49365.1 Lytic transglycosylase catalytic [Kangiella sediminilitoris]
MKRIALLSLLVLSACSTLQKESTDNASQNSASGEHQPLPAPELAQGELSPEVEMVTKDMKPQPPENLWDALSAEQSLTHLSNQRINQHKKRFLTHKHLLVERANKAAPYLHYIINELHKRNMPVELAFTPMVESNFDPLAHSVVQAAGLWQFMPRTARGFGLKIDQWYDGRRDVVASTQAALDYYEYLNEMFDGDWLLTVAAYNVGQGNVKKAIRRNARQGKPTDYWSLRLPRETMRHVPKWIALSKIFLNPQDYNVDLPFIENTPAFTEVIIDAPANLMQLAKISNINKSDFYRLNPAYNKLFIPEEHGQATILVPTKNVQLFQKGLLGIEPGKSLGLLTYTVKSGDNLSTIANKHKTSVSTLKSINKLKSDFLSIGQVLKMPGFANASEHELNFMATLDKNRQRRRYQTYRVRSGDNLWSIGKRFGVSSSQIARWNNISKTSTLRIGQRLKVWPKRYANFASAKTSYQVKSGDSLYTIARKFKVKVSELTKWNRLSRNSIIRPGQRLTIYR